MLDGLKSRTNPRSAKMRRLPANASIRATASSWVILKGKHGVGHGAVGDLLVDGEHVTTPVAASTHLLVGVDDDLGAAAGALHGDQRVGAGVDVRGARAERRAAQFGEVAIGDRLVEAGLRPLVSAEQADEHARRRPQLDLGRPALGAAVDTVVEALVRACRWSDRRPDRRANRAGCRSSVMGRHRPEVAGWSCQCPSARLRVRAPCSWRRRSPPA